MTRAIQKTKRWIFLRHGVYALFACRVSDVPQLFVACEFCQILHGLFVTESVLGVMTIVSDVLMFGKLFGSSILVLSVFEFF